MSPLAKLYSLLLMLNAFEFTALAVILGYIFCDDLNSNQIQSLGNFFESIGQTMLTIGMQQQSLQGNANTSPSDASNENTSYGEAINLLRNKISNIEEIIENIKNLKL